MKNKDLKVIVFGYGMVGQPLVKFIREMGEIDVVIVDPDKGYPHTEEIKNTKFDCAFLCLPAPTLDNGEVDISIIRSVIPTIIYRCPIFIKSTLPMGTCDSLSFDYSVNVCHLPEFLTARTNFKDFVEQDIILGIPFLMNEKFEILGLEGMLKKLFPGKKIHTVKNREAEFIKYVHNCLGALKVSYFNWAYDYCQINDLDYEKVRLGVLMSRLFSENHTLVPGPDGKRGFGGACFPKDVKAFKSIIEKEFNKNPDLLGHEKFWDILDSCEFLSSIYRNA